MEILLFSFFGAFAGAMFALAIFGLSHGNPTTAAAVPLPLTREAGRKNKGGEAMTQEEYEEMLTMEYDGSRQRTYQEYLQDRREG